MLAILADQNSLEQPTERERKRGRDNCFQKLLNKTCVRYLFFYVTLIKVKVIK